MRRGPKTISLLSAGIALGLLGWLIFRGSPSAPSPHTPAGKLRIASAAPNVTEMLFLLGVGDCVVGVTNACDYPPEAKRIEQIGGFGAPNVERLLALSPDLLVAAGFEHGEVVRVLRDSGVRVLDVQIRNIDEMSQALRQIGEAVGKAPRAEEIVADMQAELTAVAAQYGDTPRPERPRVFVEVWDDPIMTAGGASFLDDVIRRAGGVNVAHEVDEPHFRVNPEKVIEWNPDVIVVAHATPGGNTAARMAQRIGWADIAAVRRGNIIDDVPPDLMLRPGPRLIEGVKALAARFRGTSLEQSDKETANLSGGKRP